MRPLFLHLLDYLATNDRNAFRRHSHHRSVITETARASHAPMAIRSTDPFVHPLVKPTHGELEISFEATTSFRLELVMRQQGRSTRAASR
jgi:hypothetical protein